MKPTIFFWIALAWLIAVGCGVYWAGSTVWDVYSNQPPSSSGDKFRKDNEV